MEAKAITITPANRDMLASRFTVYKEDYDDMLPLGYILVTDFGNDEKFDVLTKLAFDYFFIVGEKIQNGFVEVIPNDRAMHYPR
jgi:hypothetical protein